MQLYQILTSLLLLVSLTGSMIGPALAPEQAPDGALAGGSAVEEQAEPAHDASHDRFIVHAAGVTPAGHVGSNSSEALANTLNRDYDIVEIDFFWTQDGELVCVHDWESYYSHRIGDKVPTLEEFELIRRGTYGFTSLTLEEVCQFLRQYPQLRVVTDIKTDCIRGAEQIAERYPDLLDQFILQIYDTADYDRAAELGFRDIILTVYQMPWERKIDTKALVSFAQSHKLYALTFPDTMADEVEGYVSALLAANTPLYVHTVNEADRQAHYFQMGISGIYTDYGSALEEDTVDAGPAAYSLLRVEVEDLLARSVNAGLPKFPDSGILFIGNSLVEGLAAVSEGDGNTYLAEVGISLDGLKEEIYDAIGQQDCRYVVIEMGSNELGWYTQERFMDSYKDLIAKVRQTNTDAEIVLLSIPPVSERKSDSSEQFNNANVERYNTYIRALALETGVAFLDNGDFFGSVLEPDWTSDGLHLKAAQYSDWHNYILGRLTGRQAYTAADGT